MRKVIRLPKPASLRKKASRWKRELLAKIEHCKRNKTSVPDRFYDRYQQDDVKERLEEMYEGLCCYCEFRIGLVEFGHIEHRKPKKKFPEHAFDWSNLHLACTRCNQAKGSQYCKEHPILDAVKDRISAHLTYQVNRYGVWRCGLTPRGRTTTEHADLNHEELRKERMRVYLDAMGLIGDMKGKREDPRSATAKGQLTEMCRDVYGSVVAYAMHLYGET